jgi:hypothetical protein
VQATLMDRIGLILIGLECHIMRAVRMPCVETCGPRFKFKMKVEVACGPSWRKRDIPLGAPEEWCPQSKYI